MSNATVTNIKGGDELPVADTMPLLIIERCQAAISGGRKERMALGSLLLTDSILEWAVGVCRENVDPEVMAAHAAAQLKDYEQKNQ